MKIAHIPSDNDLVVVSDRYEQITLLAALSKSLKTSFESTQVGSWNDVLYGYKNRSDAVYGLEIWLRGAWIGCGLNGPALNNLDDFRSILQFATYSDASGGDLVAARLARSGNNVYLLHDGRVHSDGRGSPSSRHEYILSGKKFFLVSDFSPAYFIENLLEFHFSRLNPQLGAAEPPLSFGKGYDPGPSKGGQRSAAVFSAQHHSITKCLKEAVGVEGFSICVCSTFFPDLLVEKNNLKILFEIKPLSNLHDLVVGLGQLLLYNQCAGADNVVLVAPPLKNTKSSNEIRKFMKSHKIKFVSYIGLETDPKFDGLQACLVRD